MRENKIITQTLRANGDGVVLDANREVRFKLYMGKVNTSRFNIRVSVF